MILRPATNEPAPAPLLGDRQAFGDGGQLWHQAEQAAASVPGQPLVSAQKTMALSRGVHGRRAAGAGEEFWQFRRWQPGDGSGGIDWRRSAKGDHLYVRQQEWQVSRHIGLFADFGPSMHYASGMEGQSKADRAFVLALALGMVFEGAGERIVHYGAGQRTSAGQIAVRRLFESLIEARAAQADSGETGLPAAHRLGTGTHIFVASDFLMPAAELTAFIERHVALGITGHLIHIIDPAEEEFPFTGRIDFRAGTAREIIDRAEAVGDTYRDRFAAHRAAIGAAAAGAGWTVMTHRSDQPLTPCLYALSGLGPWPGSGAHA